MVLCVVYERNSSSVGQIIFLSRNGPHTHDMHMNHCTPPSPSSHDFLLLTSHSQPHITPFTGPCLPPSRPEPAHPVARSLPAALGLSLPRTALVLVHHSRVAHSTVLLVMVQHYTPHSGAPSHDQRLGETDGQLGSCTRASAGWGQRAHAIERPRGAVCSDLYYRTPSPPSLPSPRTPSAPP